MSIVVAVAIGGAAGVLSRYGLDALIEQHTESTFPWATFAINVTGCLVVGFVIAAVDRHHAPDWLRAELVVGFCGGYTTFSTFAQESLELVEGDRAGLALASVTASVVAGVAAVWLGARLGRMA